MTEYMVTNFPWGIFTADLTTVLRRRGGKVRLEFRSSHHIKGEERFEREREGGKGKAIKSGTKSQ